MDYRNRDGYFDLDNFDDSIDSRDYRRRQPNRRQTNYNGRPGYDRRPNRRPNRRRNHTRLKNRIMIISAAVVILILFILLLSFMFRGCGQKETPSGVSTDIKSKQETTAPVIQSATDVNGRTADDPLSVVNFIKPTIADDNKDGNDAGAIYVWNQTGFEMFGGSEYTAQAYAETVNDLADKLTGMDVYSMIVPNHTEIGLPERLKSQTGTNSQAENIKTAYAAMNGSVKPINPYNYLAEHNDEYIYFKSDHHWTGLGSYYAYKAFADTLGMSALDLSTCTEQTIPDFTGTFFNLASGLDTDEVHYWQFPYTVTTDITSADGTVQSYDSPYFDWESSGSLTYGVFIYGDNPLTVMYSYADTAESGRKIAVVKESYGNAFVPYLTNNFEEVHVIDFRTFRDVSSVDLKSYCQQNGITDVLFLNGIMSANTQIQLDSMTALVD